MERDLDMIRELLLLNEGLFTREANILNVMSRVYSVLVPKGQVWELDPTRPFHLRLLCADLGRTPSAGVVTTSRAIQIPIEAGGAPAPAGKYEVLVGTVGGTRVRLPITGRTATTITFSGAVDAATTVDAFYLPDVALPFQLRIEDPRTMQTMDGVIARDDARLFGQIDAWSGQTLHVLTAPVMIPQDFALSVFVRTGFPVAWVDTAAVPADLPARLHLPYFIHGRAGFPATLERETVQGLVGA